MQKSKLFILFCFMLSSFSLKADINKEKTKESTDPKSSFTFIDLKGKTHNFNEYKGKWVLVNYWASYCPPCLAEMPDIEHFYQDNKEKFTVLGMDAGVSTVAEVEAFQKKLGVTYTLIPKQESTMLAFGPIMGIPTSFIVSPEGNLVEKYVGIITYADLDFHINPPRSKTIIQHK